MNSAAKITRVETGATSTLVTFFSESWKAMLDERAAFICSVRAAGGKATVARDSHGESGKRIMFRDLSGYDTSHTKGFVGWARVAS